jgi:cob(I)alamin adenosyltransferase
MSRVHKTDARLAAYADVDEANSCIGVALALGGLPQDVFVLLRRVQNDLFDVGADLCVPGTGGDRLRVTDAAAARLEVEVEQMNQSLPGLTSFILPGGSDGAAYAHVARVAVRRAERAVVAIANVNPAVRRYLNRLSDHLFVLARVLNENAATDVLWVPGANRS